MARSELNAVPNGIGLGLRWDFLEEVLDGPPLAVAFFEVSPENYMRRGGYYPAALERLKQRYPLVTHGLTLSLGARDDRSAGYLSELSDEVARLDSPWHSDHLAFTSAGGRAFHELLPLPFTHESLTRVADRADALSERLGRPFAVENITYYAELGVPELSESDFIQALCERSRTALLLDVNNVYVSSKNHGFDPLDYLNALPFERVVQFHVAGHTDHGTHIIDSHIGPVIDPVWQLLAVAHQRSAGAPVLLEWDAEIPSFQETHAEALRAREFIGAGT